MSGEVVAAILTLAAVLGAWALSEAYYHELRRWLERCRKEME